MAKKLNKNARKGRSLDEAMGLLKKAFSEDLNYGTFGDMGLDKIERFSSGSIILDKMLDGGWPVGVLCEVWGDYGTRKTTICLDAISSYMALSEERFEGKGVAYINSEHAINGEYYLSICPEFKNVHYAAPTTGEIAFETIAAMANTGEIGLIIVDSVAALIPNNEIAGQMGDVLPASHARMMSQGVKKIIAPCSNNKCTVIFINQTRQNMNGTKIPTGGKTLGYYTSLRIQLSLPYPRQFFEEDGESVSEKIVAKIIKTKIGAPDRICQTTIRHGVGFDTAHELVDAGIASGVIKKGGSWYSYGDYKAQGELKMRNLIAGNKEVFDELYAKIMEDGVSDDVIGEIVRDRDGNEINTETGEILN